MLEDLGNRDRLLPKLIRTLINYWNWRTLFTYGRSEVEVRAWTIPVVLQAPQSAGVIHT